MSTRHRRPATVAALAAAVASPFVLPSIASADVIFVRANQILPTGLQNGTSWALAFKDLQAGLAAASAGDEIWIAQGTYKPTATTNRSISFALKNDVDLIGGFAGDELLKGQRDILAHPTILSGEIGTPAITDNSLHVLFGDGTISALTSVDGVVITRGAANGGGSDNSGGGVNMGNSRVFFTSCVFRDNVSNANGSAVFTGGAIAGRRPQFANCVFTGNAAKALSIQYIEAAALFNCTFVGNEGGFTCLNATSGQLLVANCIIAFNGTGSEFDQFALTNVPSTNFVHSFIQGWDNVAPYRQLDVRRGPRIARP
jgi:hypothetical protein